MATAALRISRDVLLNLLLLLLLLSEINGSTRQRFPINRGVVPGGGLSATRRLLLTLRVPSVSTFPVSVRGMNSRRVNFADLISLFFVHNVHAENSLRYDCMNNRTSTRA